MNWTPASTLPPDSETYAVWLPAEDRWDRGYCEGGQWYDAYGHRIEPSEWMKVERPEGEATKKATPFAHPLFRMYSSSRP